MKKNTILFLCIYVSILSSYCQDDFKSWAPTPPMGWNSWDAYGTTVTEDEVKVQADYMAKYLKMYGWEYVVVDGRWFVSNTIAGGYLHLMNIQPGSVVKLYNAQGQLINITKTHSDYEQIQVKGFFIAVVSCRDKIFVERFYSW